MHNLSFEALLKLMSLLVVSLSSISHSESKAETNLPSEIVWKSSTTYLCFRGLTRDGGKDGTTSIVTRSTGEEISTASRPCAVAGG